MKDFFDSIKDTAITIALLAVGQYVGSFIYGFILVASGTPQSSLNSLLSEPVSERNVALITNIWLSSSVVATIFMLLRSLRLEHSPVKHCLIAAITLDIMARTIPIVHSIVAPGISVWCGVVGGLLSIPFRTNKEKKARKESIS